MRHFYRMMTVIILTCIMLCGCSKENPPDKIADADLLTRIIDYDILKAIPHNDCCAVAPPDFSSDNTN